MRAPSEDVPAELLSALRASASRRGSLGEPLYYFAETGSTNDVAAALAEQGASQGTTVIASAQTAGRGRLGRTWQSPAGAGLYVSIVFRDPRLAPLLTLAGGVAVADGITTATGLPVEIKWPNDIVVREGRHRSRRLKLAGILAEASTGAEGLQHVILGFGINVQSDAAPARRRRDCDAASRPNWGDLSNPDRSSRKPSRRFECRCNCSKRANGRRS